jgi:hypothetical protein
MRLKYERQLLAHLETVRQERADADHQYLPELQRRLRREAFGESNGENLPLHNAPTLAPERRPTLRQRW